jgi:3-oxoacid CoA-transferase subunit A
VISKIWGSAREALDGLVSDGMTVAVGGFGLSGNPTRLISALRDTGVKEITVVSNNMGVDGRGLGLLLENRQVRKVLASYVGENRTFARQYLDGELEVEFVPQGTLAERLRAGGAGIPAFYTPTGVGTSVAQGKPEAEFEGVPAILELGIVADLSLVRTHLADPAGNLRFRRTARNFNPLVAMAGRTTVVEADRIVDEYLDPDDVHTPGIFVQRVIPADPTDKEIEQRTVRVHVDA